MIGFLGHSHFLGHHCLCSPLSLLDASSGSNGKHDVWQLSIFLLVQRCNMLNLVHVSVSWKSHTLWTHCNSVLMEKHYMSTVNTICKQGHKNRRHPRCLEVLCSHTCPTGLQLQNTSSKIKWLRISWWQQQSIKTSTGHVLTKPALH